MQQNKLYTEGLHPELEKERVGQQAYLNSLCLNYIRSDSNFAAIDEWMPDWEKHQLVITGASGLGKSALVANWTRDKLASGGDLPYKIIYHFVGNGGSMDSHGHVIKVLCGEIRDRYGFDADVNETRPDENVLEELFNRVASEGDKPLLIILDAINQIIDIDNSKQLNWLPIPPNKVKILFTTLEEDRTMEVFKNRHYPVFTLQPLTREQREDMVCGYHSAFSKKLLPYQVERIVTDKQCENTLVLKTLLDELVNFGIFEKLDEKIGAYIGAASVEEFYGILLKGYEDDFGELFVRHILSIIAVSRNGLSEEEVLALTKETPLHWSQFFCAIRQHLIVKNGLISFAHSYIRNAVGERYLQEDREWEKECRKEIIAIFNDTKTCRAMDEVPYQYYRLDALKNLHDYILDLDLTAYMINSYADDYKQYLRSLLFSGSINLTEYLPIILDKRNKKVSLSQLSCYFFRLRANRSGQLLDYLWNSLLSAKDSKDKALLNYLLSLTYISTASSGSGRQELNQGLEYGKTAYRTGLAVFGKYHPEVLKYIINLVSYCELLGKYKKSEDYVLKAMEIGLSLYGEHDSRTAKLYSLHGRYLYYSDSLSSLNKALEIQLSLFGESHPDVAETYCCIGSKYGVQGNDDIALEYEQKALSVYISLYGEEDAKVAIQYNNVGSRYGKLGYAEKELELRKKGLDIAGRIGDEGLMAVLLNRVGIACKKAGQIDTAKEYFIKAAEISGRLGDQKLRRENLKQIKEIEGKNKPESKSRAVIPTSISSTKKNSSLKNRVIRVFISSTFRDMQGERDELMKSVFPALQRKASERCVTLACLDLRWGITPKESENGKVVEICFREIERSVPFFIGIIGNRYGWIPSPSDLGEDFKKRYPIVNKYLERRYSVTEMEMRFGVLDRKEKMHAFFFIKEQESEDGETPAELLRLKKTVRSNGKYPVTSYSDPKDLARQVEKAFSELLDQLFPDNNLSDLAKERLGQRALLYELCQVYVPSESGFTILDKWIEDVDSRFLVISGARGAGKSAMLANWTYAKLNDKEFPYSIVFHSVGQGRNTVSHRRVLKVLCDEIMFIYGINPREKTALSDDNLLEALFATVSKEVDKPLLIVLDAVNQIADADNAKQLRWLPSPPRNVKIIFSTHDDDPTVDVFRNKGFPIFNLEPLTKSQRTRMVERYLGYYSKKLEPSQIRRIVADKLCENPSVLKTLLNELISFGLYEELDDKIGSYLGAESLEDFYDILLRRYEEDYGDVFVKRILSLLALSRTGLSEDEILSMTGESPLVWSQFYIAISQHLNLRNGLLSFANEQISKAVNARYIQGRLDWEKSCRRCIIEKLKEVPTYRATEEVPYQFYVLDDLPLLHDYLMDLSVFTCLAENDDVNIARYWSKLIRTGNYSLLEYSGLVDEVPVEERYQLLVSLGIFSRPLDHDVSLSFLDKALQYPRDIYERLMVLNEISSSYYESGDCEKALEYAKKALNASLSYSLINDTSPETANSYYNVGIAYGALGDYTNALLHLENALDIRLSVRGDSHPEVAQSYRQLSFVYHALGYEQKELEYREKALAIQPSLPFDDDLPVAKDALQVPQSVETAQSHAADIHSALDDSLALLDTTISTYGENSLEAAESFAKVGKLYGIIDDNRSALDYEQRALKIYISHFGEHDSNVARLYNNLGCRYGNLGDTAKEIEFRKKGLMIALSLEDDELSAALYGLVGLAYKSVGKKSTANGYFRKAAERFRALGEEEDAQDYLNEIEL